MRIKGGKKEILQLRDKKGNLVYNRKDVLCIVGELYTTLHKSHKSKSNIRITFNKV